MSELIKEIKYMCHKCNDMFDDESEARYCCDPDKITTFTCNICAESYQDFEPIQHKCDEGVLWRKNQRESEDHGQLRFI